MPIGIVSNQVGCMGCESNIASFSAQAGCFTGVVGLLAGSADTNPFAMLGFAVINENVRASVAILCRQVTCVRFECNVATICADAWVEAIFVSLRTFGGDADSTGCVGFSIMNKNIEHPIGVVFHQIVCRGGKGDIASV